MLPRHRQENFAHEIREETPIKHYVVGRLARNERTSRAHFLPPRLVRSYGKQHPQLETLRSPMGALGTSLSATGVSATAQLRKQEAGAAALRSAGGSLVTSEKAMSRCSVGHRQERFRYFDGINQQKEQLYTMVHRPSAKARRLVG